MSRRPRHSLLLPALFLGVLLAAPDAIAAAAGASEKPAPSKVRGVCFVAGRRLEGDPFAPIKALGAEWISQTPFAWQQSADAPSLRLVTEGRVYWGETDEGIRETTRRARASGLKTLLSPHVWLHDRDRWRGEIAMKSEEDWRAWFAAYREMILHYAALARDEKIEALSVGTELAATTGRERDWRDLIGAVRKVFPGTLVYAANWDHEVQSIRFWDALDWIGVQAYYPVAESAAPARADVVAAWRSRSAELRVLASRFDRPIVFTEAGYRSQRGSLVRPWVWHEEGPVDLQAQALGFSVLFESLWDEPWFGGLFVWKWFSDHARVGGPEDPGFTPQRKPAEDVIRRGFGTASPRP